MAARRRAPIAVLGLALVLAGCGKAGTSQGGSGGPARRLAPVAEQGAVSVTTRNTTRLGGASPQIDAASVARAVYPGLTPHTRPGAVVVVDERNWAAALAAASLAGAPLRAPILYSEGGDLPAVSRDALLAMRPAGAAALGGAQVIGVGGPSSAPGGLLVQRVAVGEPAQTAAAVERVLLRAAGSGAAPRAAIVLAADAPRSLQMPAAGLAAQSGAPILFVTPARVPAATAGALAALGHPSIYVLDAPAVGAHTLAQLRHFGRVSTIASGSAEASDPVAAAIAVARYTDGTFGWGVKEPGHGLVFANAARQLDAPAAAPLSASGDYGPLLLLASPEPLPPQLASYLADIQPAYASAPQLGPVRGVYNHGWLIGDERALSSLTQAEIDALLEISPRRQSPGEAAVTQSE